jgi:4'-phosphopantetheinyl transferase EntD
MPGRLTRSGEGVQVEEVRGLFDDERVIVLAAEPTDAAIAELAKCEAEQIADAGEKRKRQFATGRALARRALARLGFFGVSVPSDSARAPIWPSGVTGSLSHCETRVVVAVGWSAEVGSLGIDVEHREGLRRDLWRMVLLAEEIEALERDLTDPRVRGQMALVLFSAKEALYKAQHPISRAFMGFKALHVAFEPTDAGGGALRCTFRTDVPPFAEGTVVRGRYRLDAFAPGREIVTAVWIAEPSTRRVASRSGAPRGQGVELG